VESFPNSSFEPRTVSRMMEVSSIDSSVHRELREARLRARRLGLLQLNARVSQRSARPICIPPAARSCANREPIVGGSDDAISY